MRHGFRGRRFNRTAEHRKAMFANMCQALIKHEQIVTTLPEGEGPSPGRRKARHAGQARRPARPPPGDRADQGRAARQEALRRARPALQGAQRRLHPHHEGRLPLRRQRGHGRDRVRRPRRRCASGKDSGPSMNDGDEAKPPDRIHFWLFAEGGPRAALSCVAGLRSTREAAFSRRSRPDYSALGVAIFRRTAVAVMRPVRCLRCASLRSALVVCLGSSRRPACRRRRARPSACSGRARRR